MCQSDGSVTTPSNSYMTYTVLNEELEGYLQLIKIDAETGKPIKIADTSFQIYKIEAGRHRNSAGNARPRFRKHHHQNLYFLY